MDLNKTIIAGANKDRRGQVFDPSGVVSKALQLNQRVYATVVMSVAEYSLEGAPQWFDSASNASLNYSSILSPYRSSNPVVVRFAVTPVYQLSDVSRLSPIGVIAYGDVLNGKVWIPETVTERFNGEVDSYAAVYYYDQTAASWYLLSSAFKASSSDGYKYDLGLDSKNLLEEARASSKDQLGDGSIAGLSTQIAVKQVDTSFTINSVFEEQVLNGFAANVFFVRGSKPVYFQSIQKQQVAIHVCNVVIQFCTSIAISAMLYRPIRIFTRFMRTQVTIKRQQTAGDAAMQKMSKISTGTRTAVINLFGWCKCCREDSKGTSTVGKSDIRSAAKSSINAPE